MTDIDNIASIFEVEITLDELDSLLQELGTCCQYLDISTDDWDRLWVCAKEVATTLNLSQFHGIIRSILHFAVLGIVIRLQLKKLIQTIYFHSDCFMAPATHYIALSTGLVNGIPINHFRNLWSDNKLFS